ncbi:MAG TPA: tail fiber protein [Candidatus Angelobacter sp.]|jgi:microcystin-dependent protein|nr:tail fiber protein [Candidatus Angelobacter sp.]
MANPFVAEIRIFGFNFAPAGWAMCNGQLMPISQNTALFSLLGTTYGGDGKSNFALPNLQGSAPMNFGQGNGLSLRDLGEVGGEQTVTLLQSEMAAHSHNAQANNATGTSNSPAGQVWSTSPFQRGQQKLYTTPANVQMNPAALSITGASLPHNNMMPYLTLSFCIALQGIFPARS